MKRVLIVDDSEQIRRRLAAMLVDSGQVQVAGQAGNCQDALELVRRLRPDTALIDIRMPGRSGIELLREIKFRFPEISVIMLTNYDNAQYRRQCEQLGADHFLNKTLDFERVLQTIAGNAAHEK